MLNDSEPQSTDYHITMTLLLNYSLIETSSIEKIAAMCTVSKSAISKFVRRMGYEDYASFKAAAPFEENKFGFLLNYNQNIAEYIEQNGLKCYAEAIQNDIRYALQAVDMKKVEELANDLVCYKKIAAFGLLFSEIGAIDLQEKLAYNNKFIITKMSDVKQIDLLERADEETLIIIYSNSGSYMQRYQLSEFQEEKDFSNVKAKIVLITSNKKMAAHPDVDLCISFGHTTGVQTHTYLYPFVNDMIVMKYRELTRAKKTPPPVL